MAQPDQGQDICPLAEGTFATLVCEAGLLDYIEVSTTPGIKGSIMERIRLLVADDHTNVRTQMVARLRHEPDLEVIGEAANSAETIEAALTQKPSVILIDPMMRDGRGLDAIRRITDNLPGTAVVVLTAVIDAVLAIELQKVGVRHILAKGVPTPQLIQALRDSYRQKQTSRPPSEELRSGRIRTQLGGLK